MKSLIVGMGEVGRSLHEVLRKHHACDTFDASWTDASELWPEGVHEALNICFPYSDEFVFQVETYAVQCKAKFVIVHSTVAVGTTRAISQRLPNCSVVHSPIHGRHPDLAEGIRTFEKYIGGTDATGYDMELAKVYLEKAGIRTTSVFNAETSELSKLMCTSQTAIGVLVMQEIHRLCQQYGADFGYVYGWNHFYNEGYVELEQRKFCRPVYDYVPGPLGGHCLKPNASLFEGWMADLIKEKG